MNNNSYLVPANSKKGTLILNVFLPFDLILFGSGIVTTLLLIALLPNTNVLLVVGACLPAMITGLLVLPIPNYHNVRTALTSIIKFYTERRMYIWKGWCFYERFVNEAKKQSK